MTNVREQHATAGSVVLSAGTWNVGNCVHTQLSNPLTNNGTSEGWVRVTDS